MAQKDQITATELLRNLLDLLLKISVEGLRNTLYSLSILNISYGHIYDDLIIEYNHKLEELSAPRPLYEFTMGNKNVAQPGGVQMNSSWVPDADNELLDFLENIMRVDHGK